MKVPMWLWWSNPSHTCPSTWTTRKLPLIWIVRMYVCMYVCVFMCNFLHPGCNSIIVFHFFCTLPLCVLRFCHICCLSKYVCMYVCMCRLAMAFICERWRRWLWCHFSETAARCQTASRRMRTDICSCCTCLCSNIYSLLFDFYMYVCMYVWMYISCI